MRDTPEKYFMKNIKLELFFSSVYLYFEGKRTTVDFFFQASGDTSPTNEELI